MKIERRPGTFKVHSRESEIRCVSKVNQSDRFTDFRFQRVSAAFRAISARFSGDRVRRAAISAFFLGRRLAILYLPRRNVDDELGELGGLRGRFGALLIGLGLDL
jgi:hypothetical protein